MNRTRQKLQIAGAVLMMLAHVKIGMKHEFDLESMTTDML
jgi:hypothetical protein